MAEPGIDNLDLTNDPDDFVKQLNLTMPFRIVRSLRPWALNLTGIAAGVFDRIAPDLGVWDGHGFVIA